MEKRQQELLAAHQHQDTLFKQLLQPSEDVFSLSKELTSDPHPKKIRKVVTVEEMDVESPSVFVHSISGAIPNGPLPFWEAPQATNTPEIILQEQHQEQQLPSTQEESQIPNLDFMVATDFPKEPFLSYSPPSTIRREANVVSLPRIEPPLPAPEPEQEQNPTCLEQSFDQDWGEFLSGMEGHGYVPNLDNP
eukprot:CAMPEP_0174251142 /NCGR_PEP_ID=MMETSP0439-20130205/1065_1 /TAXON_ID=0 /ORGANISM="Stereomyxa ramosa, Strain Chinc5" /LENGTH=191 /DNA_ID=CAMNT_0015331383 /DNA_START=587 /DNA_END=1158 /DNA_ORIENTATION=+